MTLWAGNERRPFLLHQLREERRQIADLSPAFIPLDSGDAKVLKVLVEHTDGASLETTGSTCRARHAP